MNTNLRPSGIDGLGDMSWGTHFCLFYETREDLLDILMPYFKAGLENHEFCLCVASEPIIAEEAERSLREAVPGFERYLTDGQIEIIPHMNWYLRDGRFDPLKVRQGWLDKLEQALARGYAGVRFAANISWLEKQDWDRFAEYEGKLDEAFRQTQIIGVCAYSLERCSAAGMLDVVRHHQFTLARQEGTWEPLESAELKRAHDEILKLNAELEQRVTERTAELTAINEQLRWEIIERKRSEEALRTSEIRLQDAIDAADIGLWDWDLVSGQIIWLGHHDKLFGFAQGEFDGTYPGFEKRVHPEDLEELNRVVFRARDERSEYTHEYRVIWPDGSIHWVAGRGRFVYNEAGQPVRMYGAVLDITERKRAEEAIKESEERLRLAFEAAGISTGEMDLQTNQILFSNALQQVLGFAPGAFSNPTFQEYVERVHPEDRAIVQQVVENATADQPYIALDYRIIWPDGSIHWVTSRARAFYDEAGKAIRMIGALMDITERKRAEEEIHRYAARVEVLAEISRTFAEAGLNYQDVLQIIARRTADLIGDSCVITLFSDDGQRSFPVAFHHPIPKALALMQDALLHIWQGGTDTERFHMLLAGESIYIPVVIPKEYRAQSEPEFWPYLDAIGVSSVLIVPLQVQGRVIGTLGITRDHHGAPYTRDDQVLLQDLADRAALTMQNARLFEQVQASQERLRVLSRRLVEMQESEQKRLAREIHDDVSQSLTALMMQIGTAKSRLPKSATAVYAILEQTEELTEATLERTRSIISDLRPQVLDDLGLVPALRHLGDELHESTGVIVKMKVSRLPKRLPAPIEAALFRIVQEALANVRKHAQARHATISLAKESEQVVLSVQDDGVGFEKRTTRSRASGDMIIDADWVVPAGHFGLIGIQERVTQLGGTLQVKSAPGQGTTIQVALPL